MRIIKNNQQEYECNCSHCGSQLAYVQHDLRSQYEGYFGEPHFYSYLICPVCKNKIILEAV